MKKSIKVSYINRLRGCIKSLLLIPLLMFTISCEKLLEVETPPSTLLKSQVFADDATAEAAVRGIYSWLMNSYNITGFHTAWRTGLSADELTYFGTSNPDIKAFEDNNILANNSNISQFWNYAYTTIYRANNVIENMSVSTGLSEAAKAQFTGEAKFLRAFLYFYLVNFYGDVPLVTSTDYLTNSKMARTPSETIYQQMVTDLNEAITLLPVAYPTSGRYRANKAVASALLARVYLYQGKWADAETAATAILGNTTDYALVALSDITLPSNKEAIWQIPNYNNNYYTNEGYCFYGALYNSANQMELRSDFVGTATLNGAFENGDARKAAWVHLDRYYKSHWVQFKYRSYTSSTTSVQDGNRKENSTVLRLAEQYLIRAEARAQQNKLDLAIADVNVIRARASLPLIANTNPGISKTALLDAIMQERRVELFNEWGHRWFDLKRTGKAVTVLSAIKTGFSTNDLLYPIPASELNKDPFLEQNPGY